MPVAGTGHQGRRGQADVHGEGGAKANVGLIEMAERCRELAEEALQESFVAIWNSADKYQAHLAAPMTWMATIVRNKAFDLLRRSDDAAEIDAEQFDMEVVNALREPGATPIEALQHVLEVPAAAVEAGHA